MQIASLEVRSPIKIHIKFGLFAKHAQNFQNSRNIADVLHAPLVFETTVTIISSCLDSQEPFLIERGDRIQPRSQGSLLYPGNEVGSDHKKKF